MREGWNRASKVLSLTPDELTALIQPAFPGQRVLAAQATTGGLANTNLRLTISGQGAPVLLRLYTRKPAISGFEQAVNRLVASRVPTARFLFLAKNNPVTGHPYAVLEWVEGDRLETAAPDAKPDEIEQIGCAVGAALAGIHGLTFPQTGFFDHTLKIVHATDVSSEGLQAFLEACLLEGRGKARLGKGLTRGLMDFVTAEGKLLDSWDGPPCLTHGDFGGSNMLVQRSGAGWQVAAVLDWEFAFSGSPFFDLGNLLRPPVGEIPGFEEAVARGYQDAGGRLPQDWRRMSRLADLFAWADFLNRPNTGTELIGDAKRMIERTLTDWQR